EAHSPEVAQSVAGDDGQKRKPRPDKAVESDVRWREAQGDAVTRRDKPDRPEQGRARAAQDAQDVWPDGRRPARKRTQRFHGVSPREPVCAAASQRCKKAPPWRGLSELRACRTG